MRPPLMTFKEPAIFAHTTFTFFACALVASLFASANNVFASDSITAQAQVMSADSFLRFNDLNMKFRSGPNLATAGTLGPGSVIQLPGGVTEYFSSAMGGGIDFNRTIEQWLQKAEVDPAYVHHRPQFRSCPNNQETCIDAKTGETIDTNEIYLPVKVVKSSTSDIKVDGDDNYGYVALDYIKRNISPDRYQTVRTTLDQALKVEATPRPEAVSLATNIAPSGGETTTSNTSLRPPQERPEFSVPSLNHAIRNCDDRSYRSSGYNSNNCLARKKMTQQQKAELVMSDIMEMNRRRKVNLDPRFSACIAQRESCFSPNAKGGSPDWGLFQVIDSTAKRTLQQRDPVTPGFSKYRYNWSLYKANMLQSTLAQADLHQSVILSIADWKGYSTKIKNGTMSENDYYNIARHYNGGNNINLSVVKTYGGAILSCYKNMKSAANSNGQVFNSTRLKSALNYAGKCGN